MENKEKSKNQLLKELKELRQRVKALENFEFESKHVEEKLKESFERLKRTIGETTIALTSILEKRDPYTAQHQQRVAYLACAIAQELGFSEEEIEGINVAAVLHDIGKIYVPSEILSKPGKLTESEFAIIKTHPLVACDILKKIEFPWPIAPIVLQHHERMDGSGYPHRLSDGDIVPEARILGVADVVEAMSSHRPYRAALGIDKALEEIAKNRGILYDPEVVDACIKLFKEGKIKF